MPQAKASKREQLLEIYFAERTDTPFTVMPAARRRVNRQREPVFVWTNPLGDGEQDGAVFVWTCRGRAELIGTFFRFPRQASVKCATNFTRCRCRSST